MFFEKTCLSVKMYGRGGQYGMPPFCSFKTEQMNRLDDVADNATDDNTDRVLQHLTTSKVSCIV